MNPALVERLAYLASSAGGAWSARRRACPSCGHPASTVVDRKMAVTQLRRCAACQLMFRTPTTPASQSRRFYQRRYAEGFTTALPGRAELGHLLDTGFAGTDRDYARYVEVLDALVGKRRCRLFDFGCSWGYGSWQLKRAGYQVEATEVSVPRAEFAAGMLGVTVHVELGLVSPGFDVFFSSHVLEHVPSVGEVIDQGLRLLRPGGLFVAFTPNGSAAFREGNPAQWHRLWGRVHPNFLDEVYYRHRFRGLRHLVMSSPFDIDALRRWAADPTSLPAGPSSGDELLVVAMRDADPHARTG